MGGSKPRPKFVYISPSYSKAAGFCRKHFWNLSVKQIKTKKCLGSKDRPSPCLHLIKHKAHPYWKQREVIKCEREKRKQQTKNTK